MCNNVLYAWTIIFVENYGVKHNVLHEQTSVISYMYIYMQVFFYIYLLTFSVIDLLKIKNQYVDLYCIHDITLISTILIKIDVGFLKYTGACIPSISKVNYTVAYNGCRYRVRFINTLSCFEHNSRKGHWLV